MINPVIIVPCFNHADAFAPVADKLVEFQKPVIVVDDGSDQKQSKQIKDICKKHEFLYAKNAKNGGKGAAMITGFQIAIEKGFTHALQIDADGQHNIIDIPLFLKVASFHPKDLIIGDPVYNGSAPRSRLIGRKITKFWVMIETLNKNMPDTMCGFRVYPLKFIEPWLKDIKFKRMGFDIEILVRAFRRGLHIIAVPTKVVYPNQGVSHFHTVRDNFYISLLHMYLCCLMPLWLIKGGRKNGKNK